MSIKFSPRLADADIREEGVRLVTKAEEAKAKQEYEEAQLAAKKSQEGVAEVCSQPVVGNMDFCFCFVLFCFCFLNCYFLIDCLFI